MPSRIKNTGRHLLRLDLPGGRLVQLEPGQISAPLADEALANNSYLSRWLQEGVARRVRVSPGELAYHERVAGGLEAAGLTRDEALAGLERARGVGPALAVRLLGQGAITIAQLASWKPSALAELPGVGKASARRILASARRLNEKP